MTVLVHWFLLMGVKCKRCTVVLVLVIQNREKWEHHGGLGDFLGKYSEYCTKCV
jgi:hypothetical protein